MMLTYKVAGGDGIHYGPVSLEMLEQWIHDGRVLAGTSVWRSDSGSWKPADDYLELGFVLKQADQAVVDEASQPPADHFLVGFMPRMVAYLMDYFIMTAITAAVLPLFNAYGELQRIQDFAGLLNQPAFWGLFCVNLALLAAFSIGFNGRFGATPGKILIGARIVTEDGLPIGYARALARFTAEWVSICSFGAGYLFVAFRQDRRALHDLLAGTKVVFSR